MGFQEYNDTNTRSQGASRILHLTDKLKSTQNRGETAQLKDQTQQFENKCNSFPSLGCTLDKLFTGQKPVYIEKHTWQPLDRKFCCRRCEELLKGSQGFNSTLCTGDLRSSGRTAAHCPHSGGRTSSQGQELPVASGQPALEHRFPEEPARPTLWVKAHSLHHLCLHRVFLKQTLVNEGFPFPLQCWRTCRLIQVPSL